MKRIFHPDGTVSLYRWNWGIVVGGVAYARGWTFVHRAAGLRLLLQGPDLCFYSTERGADGTFYYSTDGERPPSRERSK